MVSGSVLEVISDVSQRPGIGVITDGNSISARRLNQSNCLEKLGYKLCLTAASSFPEHVLQVERNSRRADLQA